MVNILTIFAYVSTLIAVGVYLYFLASNLVRKYSTFDAPAFNSVSADLKNCKNAGILCIVIAWLFASCQNLSDCLTDYRSLAGVCQNLGMVWILFTFVTIVLSVIFGVAKKSPDVIQILRNLRKTGLYTGLIFMALSIILKV